MSINQLEAAIDNLQLNEPNRNNGQFFHYYWIDTDKLAFQDATSVVQEIQTDVELELDDEDEVLLRLHYKGIETISDIASCTFLNKYKGDSEEARQSLEKVQELVRRAEENNLIEPEYIEGISLVLKLLTNYVERDIGNGPNQDDLREYNALSVKGQAAVNAMKLYFIIRLPPKFWNSESLKALASRMIKLDPDNAEWRICLYQQIWHDYRDSSDLDERNLLLNKLKAAIQDAITCDSDHPNVLLRFCECLVELGKRVRKDRNGVWQDQVVLAGQTFSSFEELTRCVVEKNMKIIEVNQSVYAYIKIAMGLFVRLSHFERTQEHLDFAKECLDNALVLCPSSSNVQHKLGLYALTIEDNVESAIEYFRQSFDSNPNHFGALADLLLTLMSKPDKNQAEVLESVHNHISDASPWSRQQKGQLIKIKAHLLFMQGDVKGAIDCWIQGNEYDHQWDFGYLPFRLRRYKWPTNKISLALVKDAVDKQLELDLENNSLQDLSTNLNEVYRSFSQPRKSYDGGNFRGRGGHGRGGGGGYARGNSNHTYSHQLNGARPPRVHTRSWGPNNDSANREHYQGRRRSSGIADNDDNWRK